MSDDIKVGTPVTFKVGDRLHRKGTSMGSGKRTWLRFHEFMLERNDPEPENQDVSVTAFIIGKRTYSNGEYSKGWSSRSWDGDWDGEPDEYRIEETFQVYLLVESLRNKPFAVRVEDVEVIS